jgi:hypothetical protein
MLTARFGAARFGALWLVVAVSWVGAACERPARPRPLTAEELALVEVEGGVARWLPIRFSGEVRNGNPAVEVLALEIEVAGLRRITPVRVPPLGERHFRFQYVYPKDPQWSGPLPVDAPWSVIGGTGIAVRSEH